MTCWDGAHISDIERHYDCLVNSDVYVDTKAHLPYLRSVAKGNVLEIGTDVGNSTTALLLGVKENGGHLTSVDIKDCSHLFDDPQWTFVQEDTKNFLDCYGYPIVPSYLRSDVVYIDGDHSYAGAKNDLALAFSIIRKGGLILMHDVLAPQFRGVRQAFDEVTLPKEIRTGSWGLGICRVPK